MWPPSPLAWTDEYLKIGYRLHTHIYVSTIQEDTQKYSTNAPYAYAYEGSIDRPHFHHPLSSSSSPATQFPTSISQRVIDVKLTMLRVQIPDTATSARFPPLDGARRRPTEIIIALINGGKVPRSN